MYYHVVASLDSATAPRAFPIITAPPAKGKFVTSKNFLHSAFERSNYERAEARFNLPGLGDSKPTVLIDGHYALAVRRTQPVLSMSPFWYMHLIYNNYLTISVPW